MLEDGILRYSAHVTFDENCQMENIRAFGLIHNMKDLCIDLTYQPEDLLDNDATADTIAKGGFTLAFTSKEDRGRFEHIFDQTMFLKTFTLDAEGEPAAQAAAAARPATAPAPDAVPAPAQAAQAQETQPQAAHDEPVQDDAAAQRENLLKTVKQSQISVNIAKLDSLMDLVGEIVINEAMVTHNPDLKGLQIENFNKAARQLRKLTDELQDLVMSVRMIPVANTFHKMTRIVRDMGKRLDKEAELSIIGEDTEVDKNIIDNLSDPLMHLIRNAMDHGLEPREERIALGKPEEGRISLEAVNTGGDVLITVSDDGRGLNREKILKRARERNLLTKAESDMTDKDIYALILLPGFSTKDEITEFSGRGVGMDVVQQEYREGRRLRIHRERLGPRHDRHDQDPANAGDHRRHDVLRGQVGLHRVHELDPRGVQAGRGSRTVRHRRARDDHGARAVPAGHPPDKAYGIDTQVTDLREGIMLEVESDNSHRLPLRGPPHRRAAGRREAPAVLPRALRREDQGRHRRLHDPGRRQHQPDTGYFGNNEVLYVRSHPSPPDPLSHCDG